MIFCYNKGKKKGANKMTFTELLNIIIKESGLTNKEIIEKCKEAGEPITPNYLSILKNDTNKIPSEKVALTLAKVCNAKYENILVVQAYLDRAPQPIKEFIEAVKESEIEEIKYIFEQTKTEIKKEDLVKLESLELAEFVCDYMKEWKEGPKKRNKDLDILITMFQKIQEKEKDWALIKIDHETPIKYLTDEEIKNKM